MKRSVSLYTAKTDLLKARIVPSSGRKSFVDRAHNHIRYKHTLEEEQQNYIIFGTSSCCHSLRCLVCCLMFKNTGLNLQFYLGLLSNFLGDMDVLLQDGSPVTPQQRQRLLVLLSCFSTVLQSTASGLLEINLLEQIKTPPQQYASSVVGMFVNGWKEMWLVKMDCRFLEGHGVLKTNLQLLSLQKLCLLSSSVHKILQFNSPVSQLRLHPNHLVTSSSAATYVFLLQRGNNDVVQFAITLLLEELNMLKNGKTNQSVYSKTELFSLFKFDMKVLLCCVSLGGGNTLIGKTEGYVELQASIFKMLNRLSTVEFLSKFSIRKQNNVNVPFGKVNEKVPDGDLRKYAVLITRALHVSSPLEVKLEALHLQETKLLLEKLGEFDEVVEASFCPEATTATASLKAARLHFKLHFTKMEGAPFFLDPAACSYLSKSKGFALAQQEDTGNLHVASMWFDMNMEIFLKELVQ
ncbi:hypothetical protein Tco_1374635 [Tanacetum coccineum]